MAKDKAWYGLTTGQKKTLKGASAKAENDIKSNNQIVKSGAASIDSGSFGLSKKTKSALVDKAKADIRTAKKEKQDISKNGINLAVAASFMSNEQLLNETGYIGQVERKGRADAKIKRIEDIKSKASSKSKTLIEAARNAFGVLDSKPKKKK